MTYVGPPRAGKTKVEYFQGEYLTQLIFNNNSRVPVSPKTLVAVAVEPQENARIAIRPSTASIYTDISPLSTVSTHITS